MKVRSRNRPGSHQNPLIGKGEVIDMAKMVRYVEGKMKTEVGDKAGQLIYSYDLPTSECLTVEQFEAQKVLAELQAMPAIKVALGADGKIPDQALTDVDETSGVTTMARVPERTVDFKVGRVITVQRLKPVLKQVPTGRRIRAFKANWWFSDGELYRKPTVNDLDINALLARDPKLPAWVQERLRSTQQTTQSVSSLVEELKKRLAEVNVHKTQDLASGEAVKSLKQ
jgi:hypothetical protein